MRRLILMRHAKSDWSRPGLDDHDRPLNRRGRLAAPLMGAWLRETGATPALALVSSAVRARQTWELTGLGAPSETLDELYLAGPDAILAAARRAPAASETVLIVAHQPGMQEVADRLLRDCRIGAFPTAKTVVIGFDGPDWAGLNYGAGALMAEAAPKDLI